MLIEANSDASSVGLSNKDPSILSDESPLIMQVVLNMSYTMTNCLGYFTGCSDLMSKIDGYE